MTVQQATTSTSSVGGFALPSRHGEVIEVIRRLPTWLGVPALRAFNFYLRRRHSYLTTTNYGFKMICSPRDLVQVCIMQFGHWEPNVSAVIEALAEPCSVAVDIGANVGYDTLLLSQVVGPCGGVIAFEASARTFALLQGNLDLNQQAKNVRAVHLAVSDQAGELTLYGSSSTNSGNASTVRPIDRSEVEGVVAALPLHEALSDLERERLSFIKIDVEGAEVSIMDSLIAHAGAFPALRTIVVEVSSADDACGWSRIFAAMLGAGFVAYAIENDYSYAAYLRWNKMAALVPLGAVPAEQTDVLFTQRDVSRLT